MVAERDGATTVAIVANSADAVSRIGMIFQQARRVFKLGEVSGGYFCLANSDTGQEVICARIGTIPHNPTASRSCIVAREMVVRVAGSSAALPPAESRAVSHSGLVVAFVGISPEIDSAITIAFAVSFCQMRPGMGNRVARKVGALSWFKSLFDRLEVMGE